MPAVTVDADMARRIAEEAAERLCGDVELKLGITMEEWQWDEIAAPLEEDIYHAVIGSTYGND